LPPKDPKGGSSTRPSLEEQPATVTVDPNGAATIQVGADPPEEVKAALLAGCVVVFAVADVRFLRLGGPRLTARDHGG
jgi:hypothetical protein